MPFTAADIREYATGGAPVTASMYQEGSTKGPVPVMKKEGAVYWHSGMSIDCDGQPGSLCNQSTDPYFQSQTAWNQSDGMPLKAESLPFVVLPLPSNRWNYADSGIKGGDLVVMAYKDKYVFGVVGDLGPAQRIGEASYAAAKALGINANPKTGGIGSGVTYVVFPGTKVSPIESIEKAKSLGEVKVSAWLKTPTPTPDPEPLPDPVVQTIQHVVAAGESLTQIAVKYGMTVDDLAARNHLTYAGQVLAVLKPDPYVNGLPVANSKVPSAVTLQQELKRTGFMPKAVAQNDNYGPKTQAAVAVFHNAYPQFKDPNNDYDVTISRAGWDFMLNLPTATEMNKSLASTPEKVASPVPGYGVTYPYGAISESYAAGYHTGNDYAAPAGKPVVAVVDGDIVWANDAGGAYGRWLGLRANGRDYVYCHLEAIHVGATTGAKVKAGTIIGYVGTTGNTTGPHLHFEDRPAGGGYGSGREPQW